MSPNFEAKLGASAAARSWLALVMCHAMVWAALGYEPPGGPSDWARTLCQVAVMLRPSPENSCGRIKGSLRPSKATCLSIEDAHMVLSHMGMWPHPCRAS